MTDHINPPTLEQLAALDGLYIILLELTYDEHHITRAYGVAQTETAADQETEWLNHLWETATAPGCTTATRADGWP